MNLLIMRAWVTAAIVSLSASLSLAADLHQQVTHAVLPDTAKPLIRLGRGHF